MQGAAKPSNTGLFILSHTHTQTHTHTHTHTAAALLWVPTPTFVNIPNLANMHMGWEIVHKDMFGIPNGVGSPSVSAAH